jgi:hypothetical protein
MNNVSLINNFIAFIQKNIHLKENIDILFINIFIL